MISGIPQRSCVGLLLFHAYVNDINNCIYHSKILKYADNIKVHSEISKANSYVDSSLLQQDLDNITLLNGHRYGNYHSMLINVLLLIFLKTNQQTFKIGEKCVQHTHQERDLGVIIDDNLKPLTQVANAVGKAQAALSILQQTVVSQDESIFLPIYKQLVRPHLEYATCA